VGCGVKNKKKMNNERWLQEFDATKHTFQWFFIRYGFEDEWKRLEKYRADNRADNRVGKMKSILNAVWFDLPDDMFNIKVNPTGWPEFLSLIEE